MPISNPYDLGKEVGVTLAESLLTEQKKRIVAVYAGRFQPFHAGHYSVYADMVRRFGADNVYIGTSQVTDVSRSPFSFGEKQTIISKMFGIPKNKIAVVKSPFAPEEILKKFDPKTTAVVTAFSEKDAGRLGTAGKYYTKLPSNYTAADLKGYKDKGYYYVAPVFQMDIGGQNISGTTVRNTLGNSKLAEKARKEIFKKIYGKFDPQIFKMITKKLMSEAITIPVEVGDTILTGRFKNKKTVVKSIGKDEHGMPTINGRKVTTFRMVKPAKKESVESLADSYNLIGDDMISRVLLMKEGGAAGHMAHPFDDMSLTFGDLKRIVELGLEGNLNVEAPVTEKLDGQNIAVSWRDDRGVIFARNAGHTKNRGVNAMDVNGIKQMFAGRGDLTRAFSSSAEDLQKAISALSDAQREKIFDNGRKFMSMEIIFPATQNVIPYGLNMLVFHNTIEYDDSGKPTGVDTSSARMLAGMIKQVNQNIQNTFHFSGPVVVQLPKSKNFASRKGMYFGRISRLQSQFGLKDSDTIIMWHQRWWENFIQRQARKFKYNMSNNIFMGLLQRWAFQNLGGFSIPDMRSTIGNPKFLEWALNFDKTGKQAQFKENIAPFEKLFLQLGAEILQNASGLLSASPDAGAQQLKKELEKASNDLSITGNIDQLAKFQAQLTKLNSIGIDKIIPSEGVVFMYRGKIYKLTGAFAPLNQLLGIVRYGR